MELDEQDKVLSEILFVETTFFLDASSCERWQMYDRSKQ